MVTVSRATRTTAIYDCSDAARRSRCAVHASTASRGDASDLWLDCRSTSSVVAAVSVGRRPRLRRPWRNRRLDAGDIGPLHRNASFAAPSADRLREARRRVARRVPCKHGAFAADERTADRRDWRAADRARHGHRPQRPHRGGRTGGHDARAARDVPAVDVGGQDDPARPVGHARARRSRGVGTRVSRVRRDDRARHGRRDSTSSRPCATRGAMARRIGPRLLLAGLVDGPGPASFGAHHRGESRRRTRRGAEHTRTPASSR